MNMKFYLKISSILVAAAFLSTLPVEAQTFRQTKQGITGPIVPKLCLKIHHYIPD